jgi:hypothetical protein
LAVEYFKHCGIVRQSFGPDFGPLRKSVQMVALLRFFEGRQKRLFSSLDQYGYCWPIPLKAPGFTLLARLPSDLPVRPDAPGDMPLSIH